MQHQSLSALIVNGATYLDIQQKISNSPGCVNEGWIKVSDTEPRATPLHHAILKMECDDISHHNIVKLLVDSGADIDARSRHSYGMTPLHLAVAGSLVPNLNRQRERLVPASILPLLRSDRNVNAKDYWENTPLAYLARLRYRVSVQNTEFDQSNVHSGKDIEIATTNDSILLERRTPMNILKLFATRENINRSKIELKTRNLTIDGWEKFVRWEMVLLFISLGINVDNFRGLVEESIAKTGPPFLYELLTNKRRRVARWKYMPYVYMSVNRKTLSLQLCAALHVKKLVEGLNSANELQRLRNEMGLTRHLAEYVVRLDEKIANECDQDKPQMTEDEKNNLRW